MRSNIRKTQLTRYIFLSHFQITEFSGLLEKVTAGAFTYVKILFKNEQ